MILKSIALRNFRKFERAKIDFPEGIIGIFGLNGVGKTTIFEAFAWALYGPVATRTPLGGIKREGAPEREPCRVEVEFVFGEKLYRVVRELLGRNLTTSARVTVDGKLVASGADATTKFIQKVLGMDPKTFFTSIFARQKEINALSTMCASERRQVIMKLLGIDAVDKAIKNIRTDTRLSKSLINKYESIIIDESSGESKEKILIAKKKEVEEKLNQLRVEVCNVRKEEGKAVRELDEARNYREKVKNDYEELKQRLNELELAREKLEEKKRISGEIENILNDLKRKEEEIKVYREKLGMFKGLEEELRGMEEKINSLREKRIEKEKILQDLKSKLEHLEREKKKLDAKISRLRSLGPSAPCPTCERILGEQYEFLMDKFSKEKEELLSMERDLCQKRDTLSRELERHIIMEKEMGERLKEIFKRKEEKQKLEVLIERLREEIERKRKEIEIKEKLFRSLEEVAFDREEFENVKMRERKLYRIYNDAIKRVEEKLRELDCIRRKIASIEREESKYQQILKELEEKLKEQREMKKRLEEEKRKVRDLEVLEKLFSTFRTDLISRIRPALSKYASSFLEMVTEGRYGEIELDEDYNIMIYDNGIPHPVERFSGGEEDLVNLCVRLAISEVLSERSGGDINLVILDEIFGSQDYIRRKNIFSALRALSSRFRQIFIITHIEDIKEYVDGYISVYETENGVSEVRIE